MILKSAVCFLMSFGLPVMTLAQQNEVPPSIQIRAVLHDPVHPTAELFLIDKKGLGVALELRPQDLSRPQVTQLVNGSLVLYDKAAIDPKRPDAGLAASCTVPANAKRGVVIVLPGPADSKPAYRMVFIDDTAKAFPQGESRAVALINIDSAIEAGEHRLPIHPGQIVNIPPVKKVNEYNMAQTNFYYKQGENWTVFAERQLQYLDGIRRIFIVHATPGALQPTVTTIMDTATP